MEMHPLRRDRLRSTLAGEGLAALMITAPANVSYLTDFTGDSSVLVLAAGGPVLVSDQRFTAQIGEECPALPVHIRPPTQTLWHAVAEVLTAMKASAVGFESHHLTVAELETLGGLLPAVSWKGGKDRVERLRAVKDETEVVQIREAIAIAERAFAAFRAVLRPQDSEKDMADAMEGLVRRCGGRGTSFPTIVAAGARSALPHAPPTGQAVGEGGVLLVDWGASGRLYKSDLTRILRPRQNSASSRPPSDPAFDLEEVFGVVLRAQQAALGAIRPGATGHEVDAAARSVIAAAGYGECFGHGLGHGLGLQVHEAPALRPGSEVVLEAGMVVTVEPGIYLPGRGGVRIEDDVLVTPDGGEVLTRVPRDPGELAGVG